MGRFLAVAALAAALLVPAAASAIDEPGTKVFRDEVGDSGKAADLQSVAVSSSDGTYSFTASFASAMVRPLAFLVYLNTDQNELTGSPSGAEYLVGYFGNEDFEFARWNGSTWVWNGYAGVTYGRTTSKKVVEFSIRKADIGGVRHFDFFVLTRRMDGIDDRDDGPSGGRDMWHYDLYERPKLLNGGSFVTAAKADGRWIVGVRVRRPDTGETLTGGSKIHCVAASIKALPVISSGFRKRAGDTFASCEFAIPKALKGKFVGARIDVTWHGATLTKHFSTTAT